MSDKIKEALERLVDNAHDECWCEQWIDQDCPRNHPVVDLGYLERQLLGTTTINDCLDEIAAEKGDVK